MLFCNFQKWDDLISIGNGVPEEILEERLRGIAINQPCVIVYTSGTTADPKGVLLNHDNVYIILYLWDEKSVHFLINYEIA